jgi:HEPN domain-containing protein
VTNNFCPDVQAELSDLARISKWLRKEREFPFYGDVDFIPTLEYTEEDARRARADAQRVVSVCGRLLAPGADPDPPPTRPCTGAPP